METQIKISRGSDICNIEFRNASFVKQLGSAKHAKNEIEREKINPFHIFNEPNESNKIKQKNNPKLLKKIAKEKN